jgi:hypothetical protein
MPSDMSIEIHTAIICVAEAAAISKIAGGRGGRSGGAGHQGADMARERPCREGESATLGIGAGPGRALADQSLGAGLGIQGGSPLAHQLRGHERMQHRRHLGSGWP